MSLDALLYLADDDDARRASLTVAGRPLAFRLVVAAVRAGCRSVGIPSGLRTPALERAVERSPSARQAVRWITTDTPMPSAPLLLLPAGTLVATAAVAAVAAASGARPVVLAGDGGAPLVAAPAPLARALWPALSGGRPVRRELNGVLAAGAEPMPAAAGWYARVDSPAAVREAEAALYGAPGSTVDSWLDRSVHRRLARPLARLAVAAGVTPNQITLASLAVGLAAAWAFAGATAAGAVAGLALYVVAVVLDHADGQVARLTLTESPVGEWLDIAVDTVVHALLVVALGVTAARAAGAWPWAGTVAALGVVGSAAVAKASPPDAGAVGGVLTRLANRDGFYAMLIVFVVALAAWPPALPALMVVVALGTHAFWVTAVADRLARRRRS